MSGGPSRRLGAQGLVAAAGTVALLTLLSRVVGVARWLAFSHAVGVTCVGEVYATLNQIPNVLFEIAAGGALAAVAVPLVARHLARGEEELADRTASALLGWSLVVLLPLALLVALAAGPIAGALLGGDAGSASDPGCAPDPAREVGRLMLLLFVPQIVLYGLGIVLTGVLQAHRRFVAAALAPLLSSLVVIAVYLAFGALHDASAPLAELPTRAFVLLAGGTTLGVAALSLPLLGPAVRVGIRWRPTLRFPVGAGRVAGALAVAGLAAVGAQQLFTVVVLLLSNRAGVGGIAVWNYAQTVYLLPYAVLVVPLATAAFPRLTDAHEHAVRTLRHTVAAAVVAGVAGAGALVAARAEVGTVFLALDRGRDSAGRATLEALPATLAALAPGLVGFALLAVLTRALYAAHRPRAAAVGAVLGWAVAGVVPLLLVLTGAADTIGQILVALAVGSSIGMTIAGVTLAVLVREAWGRESLRGLGRAVVAALLGAVIGVLVGAAMPVEPAGWAGALVWGTGRGLLAVGGVALGVAVLDRETWWIVRGRLDRSRPDPAVPHRGEDRSSRTDPHRAGGLERGGSVQPHPSSPQGTTAPARVLLVTAVVAGGVGQHVRQLAAGLVAAGQRVTIACPSEVADRFDLTATGADVIEVALGSQAREGLSRRTRHRLRRAVNRADVVHAHGVRAGAAAVFARRRGGPPVVVTSHNGPPAGVSGAVYEALERLVCRRADLVLGVSPDLVRRAEDRGARATALAVVPADVSVLDPAARARAGRDLREELGLDPATPVLLTAGRLAPQKRVGAAISAYHLLLGDRAAPATPDRDRPATPVLVVAGEGPEEADLRQLAATGPGEVRWLGRRDDVPRLLAAADVVISSSVWEGQPLVLQEALAAGAPIVATDVGGTSLVLGGAGVLVDGTDDAVVPALAAALADLLAAPRRREELSAQALDRAQHLPSVADAVAAGRSAYAQVLARGGRRGR